MMPASSMLTLLPLSVMLIGAVFAIVLFNHYFTARRRPHELVWGVAFLLFAVGAACQVYADLRGDWTDLSSRLYYLTGAILNVGFLGLGTVYLLFNRRAANSALVAMLVLTAISVFVIFTVPLDQSKLHTEAGWKAVAAISAGPRWLAAIINSLGTVLVVGGALWSGFVFLRKGIMKNRMIGVFLLAAGTFIVALGGTITGLTGLKNNDYLYLTMAIGVIVMFVGYLQTIRPGAPRPVEAPKVAETRSTTL